MKTLPLKSFLILSLSLSPSVEAARHNRGRGLAARHYYRRGAAVDGNSASANTDSGSDTRSDGNANPDYDRPTNTKLSNSADYSQAAEACTKIRKRCSSSSECCPGLTCNTSGLCLKPRYTSCSTPADCCASTTCVNGLCVPPSSGGGTCTANVGDSCAVAGTRSMNGGSVACCIDALECVQGRCKSRANTATASRGYPSTGSGATASYPDTTRQGNTQTSYPGTTSQSNTQPSYPGTTSQSPTNLYQSPTSLSATSPSTTPSQYQGTTSLGTTTNPYGDSKTISGTTATTTTSSSSSTPTASQVPLGQPCTSNEQCISGYCQTQLDSSATCESQACIFFGDTFFDCSSRPCCNAFQCQEDTGACLKNDGQVCNSADECINGNCNVSSDDPSVSRCGSCTGPSTLGAVCSTDDNPCCPNSGFTCSGAPGTCLRDDGQTCSAPEECSGGNCNQAGTGSPNQCGSRPCHADVGDACGSETDFTCCSGFGLRCSEPDTGTCKKTNGQTCSGSDDGASCFFGYCNPSLNEDEPNVYYCSSSPPPCSGPSTFQAVCSSDDNPCCPFSGFTCSGAPGFCLMNDNQQCGGSFDGASCFGGYCNALPDDPDYYECASSPPPPVCPNTFLQACSSDDNPCCADSVFTCSAAPGFCLMNDGQTCAGSFDRASCYGGYCNPSPDDPTVYQCASSQPTCTGANSFLSECNSDTKPCCVDSSSTCSGAPATCHLTCSGAPGFCLMNDGETCGGSFDGASCFGGYCNPSSADPGTYQCANSPPLT